MRMALTRKRPQKDKPPQAVPKRKKSRKDSPGLGKEIFSETEYFIQNGLRHVRPYYFSFTSHAKGRWIGSRVYDVFCREFQAEKPEYYEKAIKGGKVTVNSEAATMETVLQHNDLLVHRVHRHEPPVTARPLAIVHMDTDIVAIEKPPSIPVHPCGRYRHNSVVFLLGKEHNLTNLHTIHRIDRLTSGLLLFARNLATAQKMERQIRERVISKEYISKVHGEFPKEPVVCSEPIQIVTHKLGICRVDPAGKPCSTSFTRLSYDGHTSILKCEPKTGRMHQIRVHLQWLGYPIVNDPLYGHPAWGPQRGQRGEGIRNMEEVISDIVQSNYSSEQQGAVTAAPSSPSSTAQPHPSPSLNPPSTHTATGAVEKDKCAVSDRLSEDETQNKDGPTDTRENSVRDPNCTECRLVHPDPTPDQLIMYLHALRYTGPDWTYSTELPDWALGREKEATTPPHTPNKTCSQI